MSKTRVCNYTGTVNHNIRMYCLWRGKQFSHAHIPVDNKYASTTQCHLIKTVYTSHHRGVTDCLCVCGGGGVFPYRDGQYFHCGVLDLVPWVLLVSAAKQEPAKKIKHSY